MRVLGSLFLSAALLGGLNLAQAPTDSSPKTSISGTVVRAGSAQPLRNVRVSLRRANAGPSPALQRGGANNPLAAAINNASAVVATVLTDDTGRFAFVGMNPGTYHVFAERDGYLEWEYGQRSYSGKGVPITVAAGQQITDINVGLLQASVISGRVLDPYGEPASQVTVQAFAYRYADGGRSLAQIATAETNDLGEYRLFWLPPGDYFLAAASKSTRGIPTAQVDVSRTDNDPARNLQVLQAAIEATIGARGAAPIVEALAPETTALLYYPGTLEPDAATPVRVAPAAEMRGLDFSMRPVPAVTITGRVVASFAFTGAGQASGRGGGRQGNPAAELRGIVQGRRGAQVSLSRIGGARTALLPGLGFTAPVRPDGTFEFADVPPGAYYIYASAVDPNGQRHSGRTRVDVVNANVTNATLQIRTDADVRGRIVLDGQPPQSFRLEAIRVQFIPEEISGTAPALVTALAGRGANLPAATPASAQVAADGSFVLMGVGASDYRVQVTGLPNTAYVKSGRLGSTDALGRPVAVQDARELLEIEIAFNPGRVTGIVYDTTRNPVSGATAVLVPDEARRTRSDMYFTATSNTSGQFTFGAVPAGSYKLFAWEDVPAGAWQYADFIRQYEERGMPVSVSPGGLSSTDVRLIAAGE